MKKLLIIIALCLVDVCLSDEETFVIPKEVYDKAFLRYEAEHDIVDIIVPLNAINFGNSDSKSDPDNSLKDVTVFFVEADVKDGKYDYKGLYRFKNNETKMILPTGRTAASSTNDNKLVFFGASDGLYVYNVEKDSAEKYGPITDGIVSIVTDETGKTIHFISDDHKLYKVTNNGEKKEAVKEIEDAVNMVVDDEGVIYYYNSKNEIFIKTGDGLVRAQNLPENPKSVRLIRPPFFLSDSVALVCDNSVYMLHVNGTSEKYFLDFSSESMPTAFGLEGVFAVYYGHDKKLYEFYLLGIKNNHDFDRIRAITDKITEKAENRKHTLGSKKD
ncbi:uncharacterized protein LOC116775549 [Danaus plexippus]|uniref:uncharacterized protein LOC116775549 n=1 Tax=Danaus plexippus TaxID=13037 RepID=UPI002AB25B54|nr:uncharacterized protein LOC116775549 [Danaus plexippus]XP_061381154.1 uncharacterized protein LOC116775549 [Danaus plexippus]